MTPAPKILSNPLRILISILIIGILLRVQDLSAGQHIVGTASLLIAVVYSIRFFKKNPKTFLDFLKEATVIIWAIRMVLITYHLPFVAIANYAFLIALTLLIVMWSITPKEKADEEPTRSSRARTMLQSFFMGAAGLFIVLGAIFKIQHYPGATYLMVSGALLGILYFLIPVFWRK